MTTQDTREGEERPDVLFIYTEREFQLLKECGWCNANLPHEEKIVKRRWPKK